ncbi:hypothetical protein C8Q79DRAFT_194345 [Trametes meyenii]|nr:hypothetical protein C8Q79DRAFT_194345 [Trametes meyenii]
MILYKERDVERKAWERHGGPEGFDAYLAKLRGQHTRTRTTAFTQPSTYSSNGVYLSQARTRLSTFDMRTGTPQVLHRTQMEMPNWLWNVCNKILDWYDAIYADPYEGLASLYATTRSREAPMEAAARVARSYPPRPVATLPPSPTVDAVRAILAEAPRLPHGEPHEAWSEEALFARGITATHHSWPEDEYTYEWSSEYLDRLFSALCEVIIALGTGDAGWRAIRWEVHDKYLDCFKGMSYDRKERRWTDEAAQWLDGSYPTTGRDISFAVSSRSKSSEGERYNAALPYRTPQDVRRVGY